MIKVVVLVLSRVVIRSEGVAVVGVSSVPFHPSDWFNPQG